jgi:hypothetical protein
MFLNQYGSILNGPPSLGGFRLGAFAGAYEDAMTRFYQELDLAQKSQDLIFQSADLNKQALAEFDPVKRAAIRKQEFDVDAQVSDIAQQMNDLNVQDTMSLDPSIMSDADKAKFVQDRNNQTATAKKATEESHKFLLQADNFIFLPPEQKQAGSAAEATYVKASDSATQAIYTALAAGDPVRSDNSALSATVDNRISTAAQKVLEHPITWIDDTGYLIDDTGNKGTGNNDTGYVAPQIIVSQTAATSTNDIATAAQTAISVTSTTTAPVFSNPTIATPMVAITAPVQPTPVQPTPIDYVAPITIERAKPSFTPLIAIAGLAFLLGKI